MITGTLFKKQTNTNGNRVQKCQHQILLLYNPEITSTERSSIQKNLPQNMLDPGPLPKWWVLLTLEK